ncbi:hypothetical protein K4A83_06335 [Spirulina subsalsa FACHB-351]|uniref:HPr kinase n=2 Tax=Spirulina subsalsa TaxID=54311 RepID=A0ABT3L458_9CYAN|nr:hypothetical protein [Spirulina subsalsa FACHB-351]
MIHYQVYGLELCSDAPIPGVAPVTSTLPPENLIPVSWGQPLPQRLNHLAPWYVSPTRDLAGLPLLRVWRSSPQESLSPNFYHFRYSEGVDFLVQCRPTWQIWTTWQPPLTLEDAATYLLGPILGFILRLKGLICLHASAVAIGNQAIAFLGSSGAGKSTTAAAFAQQGYPILADDVVVLTPHQPQFLVQPAYPRLRLWSESVQHLYGSPEHLPRIVPSHPTWHKQYLDLTQPGYQFQPNPLPLKAIYHLQPRSDQDHAPYLTSASLRDHLITLVTNTYTNYLLDKPQRQQEFILLHELLKMTLVKKITPHKHPERLPQLLELILADLANLAQKNQ